MAEADSAATANVLREAEARLQATTRLLSTRAATIGADKLSLSEALRRLADAEAGARATASQTRDSLDEATRGAQQALDGVRERVQEARARASRASQAMSEATGGSLTSVVAEELESSVATMAESVSTASATIASVRASVVEGREHAIAAIERMIDSVGEASGSTREAAETVVSVVEDAAQAMTSSVEEAEEGCASRGTEFGAFVHQLVAASIRSPVDAIASSSKDFVENQIRARAADAVAAVVQALVDAAESFRSDGGVIAMITGETGGKFERLGASVSSVSAKADHVIAEEQRVLREQEENEGGGEDV